MESLSPLVFTLQEKGKPFDLRWVGVQALEVLRIEAGIPRYGVDMDEENLLLETGLEHAVSFDKGCYLGQETIERIHSRGHVNKNLVGILPEGAQPLTPGDPVYVQDNQVGMVTSSTFSPTLKRPLALGYVKREFTAPGTEVSVRRKGDSTRATISSLPFYSR